MESNLAGTSLGCLLLGIILGILLVKWATRFLRRHELAIGLCTACGKEGYLVHCDRCGKAVAWCHYYAVLYPGPPEPKLILKSRKKAHICTDCLPPRVRETLEELA